MKLIDLRKARDPYNYCDRWCARCLATGNCPIFGDEKEYRRRCLAQGKDPDSMEAVLEQVSQSFRKTHELIKKSIVKWDLDLDIDKPPSPEEEKEYQEQEAEKEDYIHKASLFQLARQWEDYALHMLRGFTEEDLKNDPDPESVLWFATLIPSKVYRALSSDYEDRVYDDGYDDAENSAGIALRGINTSLVALVKMKSRYPKIYEDIELIAPLGNDLKAALEEFINQRSLEE